MTLIRWLALIVALPALMVALAACGDDGGEAQPTESGPTGPVEVVAQGISFVPSQIVGPEETAFTLTLDNQDDGISHSIAIFILEEHATDGTFGPVAATEIGAGPNTQSIRVTALPAGEYFVWCEVHTSQMTATLFLE